MVARRLSDVGGVDEQHAVRSDSEMTIAQLRNLERG